MKLLIICIVAGLVINSWPPIGFWGLHTGDVQASEGGGSNLGAGNTGAGEPVACVNTTPLKQGSISETIVVYGSIIAAPGALLTVSIPFESQVLGIMVNEGQKVSKGDILLKIKPSPDTMLQLDQARNAHKLARESYRQMEGKRKLRLATNDQMIQARQALDQARLGLESLKNRGIDGENNYIRRFRVGAGHGLQTAPGAVGDKSGPLAASPRDDLRRPAHGPECFPGPGLQHDFGRPFAG